MVQRWITAMLLLVTLVVASGVQVSAEPWVERPHGQLIQRSDGTYGYVVSDLDQVGQWQVAFGAPQIWVELVKSNPQLADPDYIKPGQTLNVPPSLVNLFHIVSESDAAGGPMPAKGVGLAQSVPETVVVAKTAPETGGFPWLWLTLVAILIGTALALLNSRRKLRDRMQSAEQVFREREDLHRNAEQSRRYHDPYSGPSVRENGLPTAEAAAAYFAESLREQRERMTVLEDRALPPVVRIVRIVAVDVRGFMRVRFASGWQERNVLEWTPAWQAFLDDGTFLLTFWRCANDVKAGGGVEPLPATQIRPREDVPVYEPATPIQVWPPVPEGQPVAASASADAVIDIPADAETLAEYTSVKVTSATRYVLHTRDNRDVIIDVGPIPGITIGIEGAMINALVGDQRRNIGRLVDDGITPRLED